jgi:hypothetical protein
MFVLILFRTCLVPMVRNTIFHSFVAEIPIHRGYAHTEYWVATISFPLAIGGVKFAICYSAAGKDDKAIGTMVGVGEYRNCMLNAMLAKGNCPMHTSSHHVVMSFSFSIYQL